MSLGSQLLQHLVEEGELAARLRHGANFEETVGGQRRLLGRA